MTQNEKEKGTDLDISPNPFTENVSINNLSQGDEIRISSVLGETLLKIVSEENLVQINQSDLKPGIYIVTLNNSIPKKIVKL